MTSAEASDQSFSMLAGLPVVCISRGSGKVLNIWKKNLTPDLLIWNFWKVLISENFQKFRTFQKFRSLVRLFSDVQIFYQVADVKVWQKIVHFLWLSKTYLWDDRLQFGCLGYPGPWWIKVNHATVEIICEIFQVIFLRSHFTVGRALQRHCQHYRCQGIA